MASTINFATMPMESLAAYSIRMFEVFFWDVCEKKGWVLTNDQTQFVESGELTRALLAAINDTPKQIPDDVLQNAYQNTEHLIQEKKIPQQENSSENVPETIVAPPVPQPVLQPVVQTTGTKVDPKRVKHVVFKGAKIDMPYLPNQVDYSKCCQGIKINGGLLSPCLTHVKEGGFCKPCQKLQDTNQSCGTLSDREAVPMGQFVSKKTGKKEISFATYLQKRNITIDEFNVFIANEIGASFQIPNLPEYCDVDKKKTRRSQKSKASDDDSSTSSDEDKPKRKPGRPKSEKKEVVEQQLEPTVEEQAEKNLFGDNANDDAVSPMESMEEKKEEAVVPPETTKPAAEVSSEEDENSDEMDDSGIVEFTEDGKTYARDEEGTVFILEDGDPTGIAGTWDPISKKILFKSDD